VGFARGRALVAGLAVGELPEAVLADTRDIAEVLRADDYCGYPPGQVRLLLDRAGGPDALRGELAGLAAAAGPADTVLIYLAGDVAMSAAEFVAALDAIPARRLLVLLDAGLAEAFLERPARGAGRVVVASARAGETPLVLPGARNSVFAGHLVEALLGGAPPDGEGLIRVRALIDHVTERVHRTVPGRQHPVCTAPAGEDFPIACHRGGAPAVSRPLEDLLPDLYPAGPAETHVWERAGGELSRLRLTGHGRADWYGALRTLRLGGGGRDITLRTLLDTVLADYPDHPDLRARP